jgi:hypothetical protein
MTGGVTILPGLSPASIRVGDRAVKSARIPGVEDFTSSFHNNIPGKRWFFHYLPGRSMTKTGTKGVSASFRDLFEFFAIAGKTGQCGDGWALT